METPAKNSSWEEEDEKGETWVATPQNMIGFIVGKRGKRIQHIMNTTDTRITVVEDGGGDNKYFVIKGKLSDRYLAKLKIKRDLVCTVYRDGKLIQQVINYTAIDDLFC